MMMREERAKQFAAFDAMKGLQEALRDREERHLRVERHEISEEQMEKNSEVFAKIIKGTKVHIDCHWNFHDISLVGTVTSIDTTFHFLRLGTEKLPFADIYSIEILDQPTKRSRI